KACSGIAAGDYTQNLHSRSQDELGRMQRALAAMQDDLRSRIAREAEVAAENARVRAALDTAATSSILADETGQIIYLNESMRALLGTHASELRRELSWFDPETLVGQSLGMFGRGIRSDAEPMTSREVHFGAACFLVSTGPVLGAGGKRLGTVMQWLD